MAKLDMIVISTAHPKKELEKCSMALAIATSALATDQKVALYFALDGVYTLVKGFIDGVSAEHFAPLKDLIAIFKEEGEGIYVCTPFMAQRKLTEKDLIDGVIMTNAPSLVSSTGSATIVCL